jgi:hypothetical protein
VTARERAAAAVLGGLAAMAGPAAGQGAGAGVGAGAGAGAALTAAVARVRAAWLAHDAARVVGSAATIVLQIPGTDASAPLGRAQAVALLRRYLRAAMERSVQVTAVRDTAAGQGQARGRAYAELERRYVVAGTSDERRETVFLGFEPATEGWQLVEIRIAP